MKGARRMYIFVILSVALSEYPSVILVSPSILLSLSPPPPPVSFFSIYSWRRDTASGSRESPDDLHFRKKEPRALLASQIGADIARAAS